MRMLEVTWWGLVFIILGTIVAYTFIFLLALRGMMKGQKGRFLYNLPIAPFSVKSRIYTIAKQLEVEEDEVTYVGNNIYKVKGLRLTVEGFFGVVVYQVDKDNVRLGAVKGDIQQYNLANLRVESGEEELDDNSTK